MTQQPINPYDLATQIAADHALSRLERKALKRAMENRLKLGDWPLVRMQAEFNALAKEIRATRTRHPIIQRNAS